MQKLVSLGILTKTSTTHTSPVMLVARKENERKRPVVNFRLLNTRIVRRNTSTPLLRDIFIMLGRAQCEVLSCVDLKEAFHSLPLASEAKEFCGILPYFGSPHFRHEVLPMGLAISPQVWIDYIENILCGMANKQDYIAIMDDLLIHGFKGNHLDRLEALFKAMIKWTEIVSQEVPTFHEASYIYGKCIPYKWFNNFHNPSPIQNRSNTETTTPNKC